MIEHITDS